MRLEFQKKIRAGDKYWRVRDTGVRIGSASSIFTYIHSQGHQISPPKLVKILHLKG
jgi:hypothetical protein